MDDLETTEVVGSRAVGKDAVAIILARRLPTDVTETIALVLGVGIHARGAITLDGSIATGLVADRIQSGRVGAKRTRICGAALQSHRSGVIVGER